MERELRESAGNYSLIIINEIRTQIIHQIASIIPIFPRMCLQLRLRRGLQGPVDLLLVVLLAFFASRSSLFFSPQSALSNLGCSWSNICIVLSTFFISDCVRRRYLPARKSAIVRCLPLFPRTAFCASTLSAARCAVIIIALIDRCADSMPRYLTCRVCHTACNSSSQEG